MSSGSNCQYFGLILIDNIRLVITIDDRIHMLIGNWIPILVVSIGVLITIDCSKRIPIPTDNISNVITTGGWVHMIVGQWSLIPTPNEEWDMLIGNWILIPIVGIGVEITTGGRVHMIVGKWILIPIKIDVVVGWVHIIIGTISVQVGLWYKSIMLSLVYLFSGDQKE